MVCIIEEVWHECIERGLIFSLESIKKGSVSLSTWFFFVFILHVGFDVFLTNITQTSPSEWSNFYDQTTLLPKYLRCWTIDNWKYLLLIWILHRPLTFFLLIVNWTLSGNFIVGYILAGCWKGTFLNRSSVGSWMTFSLHTGEFGGDFRWYFLSHKCTCLMNSKPICCM